MEEKEVTIREGGRDSLESAKRKKSGNGVSPLMDGWTWSCEVKNESPPWSVLRKLVA